MGFLDFLFGAKKREVEQFLKNGALVLDVRSEKEYKNGHLKGSKNVPLNELQQHIDALKALNTSFVVCCQSGVRSSKAAKFLNLNNIQATNGGGWLGLKNRL